MASIIDRLFRRQGNVPVAKPPHPNPVAIPVPDGMPPELLNRSALNQPRDPSRKRKRRTKEEIATDTAAWRVSMLERNRLRFDFDRERAEAAGATHYRWWSCRDGSTCKTCRSREGKQFPLRAVPKFQHPGFMLCDDDGEVPCRCYYELIMPK